MNAYQMRQIFIAECVQFMDVVTFIDLDVSISEIFFYFAQSQHLLIDFNQVFIHNRMIFCPEVLVFIELLGKNVFLGLHLTIVNNYISDSLYPKRYIWRLNCRSEGLPSKKVLKKRLMGLDLFCFQAKKMLKFDHLVEKSDLILLRQKNEVQSFLCRMTRFAELDEYSVPLIISNNSFFELYYFDNSL